MLEFNIDKQGGIRLHTCERKSRWCKFWLWLSWVSIALLLGWLFFKGFLDLNKTGKGQAASASVPSAASANNPVNDKTVAAVIADCPETDASETAALNTKNKALAESCDKKLSALNAELNGLSELKESHQALKLSATSFDKSKADLLKEKEALTQKLTDIISENKELSKQLAVASEATTSDKQTPVPDLNEKLYFYENILKVNDGSKAVGINHFVFKKDETSGNHRLQMVLARLGESQVNSNISGTFDVFLKGNKRVEVAKETTKSENSDNITSSGPENKPVNFTKEVVTYKHADLMANDAPEDAYTFSFKYYQNIESEVTLPEFFELESVSVSVKPQGLPSVSNNYEWKELEKLSFKEIK